MFEPNFIAFIYCLKILQIYCHLTGIELIAQMSIYIPLSTTKLNRKKEKCAHIQRAMCSILANNLLDYLSVKICYDCVILCVNRNKFPSFCLFSSSSSFFLFNNVSNPEIIIFLACNYEVIKSIIYEFVQWVYSSLSLFISIHLFSCFPFRTAETFNDFIHSMSRSRFFFFFISFLFLFCDCRNKKSVFWNLYE